MKHQVVLFFPLAYLVSWWSVPLIDGRIMAHGPAIAALIILAITAGRQGLSNFWHNLISRGAGWYWYVIAASIHLAYIGGAFLLSLLFGGQAANPPSLSLATIGLLVLLGGQWEEFGWTGYALPRLLKHYSSHPNDALKAVLIAGVFRSVWHLPLFLYGYIPWYDIAILSFALQILIAWLYIKTRGCTLVVIWFHFTSNIMGALMATVFTGADRTTFYALFVALAAAMALLVLWKSGLEEGLKRAPFQLSHASD